MAADWLVVEGADIPDDMVYSANARWYFTPQFSVGVDISKYDDLDLTSLGLSFRYDFGKSR